ncbi:MAG TPA: hypothetical protein VEI26_09055 [Terriglobales bacterium]|nr:hypothetical protein [Terriglobales bacterium]
MTQRIESLEQIEKLLASQTLHGSESLCKLLRYLANHSLEHSNVPPKEYQIATEVFGRQKDFDPHLDSMVRVQIGRLRSKLAEYYASEGTEDPLVVEVPKGTYALAFHPRTPQTPQSTPATAGEAAVGTVADASSLRRWFAVTLGLSIILTAIVAIATDRLLRRRADMGISTTQTPETPAALRVFWQGFLTGPGEPWVIFSNAAFIGLPDVGMRYYDPSRDPKDKIFDHYTGVGEVLAVHSLDTAFGLLHQPLRVKRGSLFSLDDAKNNDLIFVGSPTENLTLLDIPGTQSFVFKTVASGSRKGNVEIINVHPRLGEPREFLATPANQPPLTEEYSVVALVKGLNPSRSALILAGTTTIGTQAAVEYVCQQSSLEGLLQRLSVSKAGDLKPFEAVIHVKVVRGVPVGSELVALRK